MWWLHSGTYIVSYSLFWQAVRTLNQTLLAVLERHFASFVFLLFLQCLYLCKWCAKMQNCSNLLFCCVIYKCMCARGKNSPVPGLSEQISGCLNYYHCFSVASASKWFTDCKRHGIVEPSFNNSGFHPADIILFMLECWEDFFLEVLCHKETVLCQFEIGRPLCLIRCGESENIISCKWVLPCHR